MEQATTQRRRSAMYLNTIEYRYMRSDTDFNDVLLALSDTVEPTSIRSDWDKLALWVEGGYLIEDDSRLLRSQYFGDDDYGSNVIRVIRDLMTHNPKNIQVIERYVELKSYLEKNNPVLYGKLYAPTPVIEDSGSIPVVLDNIEISKQYLRIRSSIENDDPALTIGTSKEMLETVLKAILDELGQHYTRNDDIPRLLKEVQKHLGIDPNSESAKVDEILRRTLNNFGQIVVGVTEMRNLAGTGHGKTSMPDVDRERPRPSRTEFGICSFGIFDRFASWPAVKRVAAHARQRFVIRDLT